MWKWLLGGGAVLVWGGGLVVANLQTIMLRYPVVLSWISQALDPIGPTQEVTWAPGPETATVSPAVMSGFSLGASSTLKLKKILAIYSISLFFKLVKKGKQIIFFESISVFLKLDVLHLL